MVVLRLKALDLCLWHSTQSKSVTPRLPVIYCLTVRLFGSRVMASVSVNAQCLPCISKVTVAGVP